MTVFETAEFLRGHDRYLILTHTRPDGDTVGCAAGLCRALRDLGKTAFVLPNPEISEVYADYLDGLTCGADYIPDTVVCVDIAAATMFPLNMGDYAARVDLTIDHHGSQEFYARHTCLDASAAACGEIIYEIVKELVPVTAEIAAPLYVAVSTDCGCFAYGNTTANTHRVAAALTVAGIDLAGLNKRHFRTKSFRRMKLESASLGGMELHDDGDIAIASISLEMMNAVGATREDIEDIAALVGMLEGVKVSATLREMEQGKWKISMRSDPAFLNSSNACALLGGGGHPAASGATFDGDQEQTKRAVLDAIHQVKYGH